MQSLGSYAPENHEAIQHALEGLSREEDGLQATTYLSRLGWFARFVWPDWPEPVSRDMATEIESFRIHHPELRPVDVISPEWVAVFPDWRSDSEIALGIADCLTKHFGERVSWIEAEKNSRGRIAASSMIRGIGKVVLDLGWREYFAFPSGGLSHADVILFAEATKELSKWAGRRIEHILSVLNEEFKQTFGDRYRGIYVYGSYAKRDAGLQLPPDSDLDIALVLTNFEDASKELAAVRAAVAELSLQNGLVISTLPVRESDVLNGQTSLARSLAKDAIQVRK